MAVTPTHLPVCTVIVNFSFLDKLCSLHFINFKLGHIALRAAKTPLHSEQPKLLRVLAIMSATELK